MCMKANTIYTQLFGHVQLFVIPWTVAHQTSLSMGFSKQEYWSGLPFWYQLLRFYFEAHWQGDGGRAQICVLICGLVKLLWINGGWVGLHKCWWGRLPLVSFRTWSSLVKCASGFNMGSSRTVGPSLLKGFWHSSFSHALILWFPGGCGGSFGFGCYLRSTVLSSALTLAAWLAFGSLVFEEVSVTC